MVKEIVQSNNFEKRIATILLVAVILTAALYGYLVKQTIVNVVERQALLNDMNLMRSRVAAFESRYITLSNGINRAFAERLGFHEATDIVYVSRSTLARSLSLNEGDE